MEAAKNSTGNPAKKEDVLDDGEFAEIFGLDRCVPHAAQIKRKLRSFRKAKSSNPNCNAMSSRAAFQALPKWKQQQKKKQLGLF
mmetsp:Transcript_10171/g.30201  ORF Transcript_10171/g.30201 Transcript_10171/m.30201 type:complete len:84 (-) Transcript_10171:1562-1813(-)